MCLTLYHCFFFFSSRRRHTRFDCDWSSDVCSSDLNVGTKVSINPTPCPEVLCPAESVSCWCCAPSPSPSRTRLVPPLLVRVTRSRARCAPSRTRTACTDARVLALAADLCQLLQGLVEAPQLPAP